MVEFLPSKHTTNEPSVNPAPAALERVPASGRKGGEKQVNNPNNTPDHESEERVKRALYLLTYGQDHPPGDPDHTLSWGLSQWKIIARADGRAEDTVEWVKGAVKLMTTCLGDIPLSAVTPQEMRRFINLLRDRPLYLNHPFAKPQKRERSPGGINSQVRAIRSMFSTLARESLIPENPLRDYHPPSAGESQPASLSVEQMKTLLSQPDQSRPEQFRDFVTMSLFYDSKCRLSELAAIDINKLDLQGSPPSFTVPGKGRGKGKRILTYYFSPLGAKLILRYMAIRPAPAPEVTSVFLRHDGQPITAERIYRQVKHYGKKAGIDVHPHMFRHSGAKQFLRAGGNLPELQQLLQHRSMRSTMIYAELESEDGRRAAARYSPLSDLGIIPPGKKRPPKHENPGQ